MTLSNRLIHSLGWRLCMTDTGIAIYRVIRWVVPRLFPYQATPSPLSDLAISPNYSVEVRPSTVVGADRGLFALEAIPGGEVLGEYSGDRITSLAKWLRLRDKDFVMFTNLPELVLDAAPRFEVVMRYVNHHFDACRHNLVREVRGERVFYQTTRLIVSGEEFFVDYGDLYWKLRGVKPSKTDALNSIPDSSQAKPYLVGNGGQRSGDSKGPCKFRKLRRVFARWLRRPFEARLRSAPLDQLELALVIPLADEVAHGPTQLQIEILRKYGHNPGLDAYPHITLKMGFPVNDAAPIAEYIEQLANGIAPFDVSIRNFDFFDEGIMFLDVESNPELEKLRQRILTDLSEHHGIKGEAVEGPQFRFHVTLAYGLARHEFAELRKSYASRQIQFHFQARHIDLFCHTGQQWVTYQRAPFRGAPPPSSWNPN